MGDKKMNIIIISGGFDPIHVGHVRMLKEAQSLGEKLIVIVNNDNWLMKKKEYCFMPEKERLEIIEAMIRPNDVVILTNHSIDFTDRSVCKELRILRLKYPNDELIFANGGDRLADNIPEVQLCTSLNIEMIFNIGGGKIQSSSDLVKKYKENK